MLIREILKDTYQGIDKVIEKIKNPNEIQNLLKFGYINHDLGIKDPRKIMYKLWAEAKDKLEDFDSWEKIRKDFIRNEENIKMSEEIKKPESIEVDLMDFKSEVEEEILAQEIKEHYVKPQYEILKTEDFILKSKLVY